MNKTKIDWCDSTWNPISGCLHECPYCFARKIATRFSGKVEAPEEGNFITLEKPFRPTIYEKIEAYPYGFTPTFHKYKLCDLKNWKFGKNIFVGSMSDIFGEWVPTEAIKQIFEACKESPEHRYFFLTKNPKRYYELANEGLLPDDDNFWYGSTITCPDDGAYWSELNHTFCSVEPILAPFVPTEGSARFINRFEWVIFGAETGNRKDKVIPEKAWVSEFVSMCQEQKVPVFMKDSMKNVWGENLIHQYPWEENQ